MSAQRSASGGSARLSHRGGQLASPRLDFLAREAGASLWTLPSPGHCQGMTTSRKGVSSVDAWPFANHALPQLGVMLSADGGRRTAETKGTGLRGSRNRRPLASRGACVVSVTCTHTTPESPQGRLRHRPRLQMTTQGPGATQGRTLGHVGSGPAGHRTASSLHRRGAQRPCPRALPRVRASPGGARMRPAS